MSPPRRCQKRCFEHYRGGRAAVLVVYDMLPLPNDQALECRPNTSDGCALWRAWQDICCISAAVADEVSEWLELTGIMGLYVHDQYFHLGVDLRKQRPEPGVARGLPALRSIAMRPPF